MTRLIHGVGFYDSNEPTQITKNGKVIINKAYQVWYNMLKKCYGKNSSGEVSVAYEWLTYTNFKNWYDDNYRENCKLNNTLFGDGSIYSKHTTVFLDKVVTYLIRDTSYVGDSKGLGKQKHSEKYHVRCNNPLTCEQEHVGYFLDLEVAKAEWLLRKRKIARKIADLQTDDRVKNAILNYF